MSCSPKWPRRDVRLKRVGKLNWGWNNWFIWIFEHLFQFQEQWVRPGAKTFPSKHVHTKVRHLDIVFVIRNTGCDFRVRPRRKNGGNSSRLWRSGSTGVWLGWRSRALYRVRMLFFYLGRWIYHIYITVLSSLLTSLPLCVSYALSRILRIHDEF